MAGVQLMLSVPVGAAGVLAVKRAVLAWAGQEQAGSVQLLPFISDNTKTWQRIQTGVVMNGNTTVILQMQCDSMSGVSIKSCSF